MATLYSPVSATRTSASLFLRVILLNKYHTSLNILDNLQEVLDGTWLENGQLKFAFFVIAVRSNMVREIANRYCGNFCCFAYPSVSWSSIISRENLNVRVTSLPQCIPYVFTSSVWSKQPTNYMCKETFVLFFLSYLKEFAGTYTLFEKFIVCRTF